MLGFLKGLRIFKTLARIWLVLEYEDPLINRQLIRISLDPADTSIQGAPSEKTMVGRITVYNVESCGWCIGLTRRKVQGLSESSYLIAFDCNEVLTLNFDSHLYGVDVERYRILVLFVERSIF